MMMNNLSTMDLFAHRKGGGPTANDHSPTSHHLGAKRTDDQAVNAGSIIYRQRGAKIHPGKNIGIGGNDILFALVNGAVKFECLGKTRKQASVYPVEEAG